MKCIKKTEGFDGFMKGTVGNGGQNLYVSRAGILQRIYNFDTTQNGYPDLPFANSQSMGERPDVEIYTDADMTHSYKIPSNGSFDGTLADLTGDGLDDLVIACQNNGTHADGCAIIYFATENGYDENYRIELPVPDGTAVTAGDFRGNGRKSLCFISGSTPRLFEQDEMGFNARYFTDLPFEADALIAADFDGDGFDDLCLKCKNGARLILFGSQDGLDADHPLALVQGNRSQSFGHGSTNGRRLPYRAWRPCAVRFGGETLLYIQNGDEAEFYRIRPDKTAERAFSLSVPHGVYATSGDFNGDGQNELFVTVMSDKNKEEKSLLFGADRRLIRTITTKAALTATACDVNGDGKDELIIAQCSDSILRDADSQTVFFDETLSVRKTVRFSTGETQRVLCGHTQSKTSVETVIIHHETGRVRGDENTYIYLGSADGYSPDRRVKLPGWSAVDMLLADFNDDGRVDCLVSNCAENYPQGDPGSFLYTDSGKGLNAGEKTVIDTIRNHGAAIGDFDHAGYLDIACGGIYNREIRILHGGPWGWDTDHMERVVFGPDPEHYHPYKANVFEDPNAFTPEERQYIGYWGENRWLVTADYNNDGWLDLFVTLVESGYAYILWGGPEGYSLERSTRLNCDGAICATAADLRHTGYLDLIVGGHVAAAKGVHYETYITVYWGGPDGYSDHRKMMLPCPCANSVTVGDFNKNGWLDIYATAYNNGRVRDLDSFVYLNDHGHFSVRNRKRLFNHSGCGCVAGDFNNDGYTDLAVACHKEEGDHKGTSFVFWGGPDGLSDQNRTELPTVGPHGMSTVDPGNIVDRSDAEYYTSEVFDFEAPARVTLSYEATFTSTSYLKTYLRSSSDKDTLDGEPWVEADTADCRRFVQYRLALCARCGCGTPRITSVTLTAE